MAHKRSVAGSAVVVAVVLLGVGIVVAIPGSREWAGRVIADFPEIAELWERPQNILLERAVPELIEGWPVLAICRGVTVLAAGFGIVLALSALRRMAAGASPVALLRGRCRELAPARGLIVVVYGVLLIMLIASLLTAARSAYFLIDAARQTSRPDIRLIVWTSAATTTAILTLWVCVSYYKGVVCLRDMPLPVVNVDVRRVRKGISRQSMAQLGRERFPNQLGNYRRGLRHRGQLALLFFARWQDLSGYVLFDLGRQGTQSFLFPYASPILAKLSAAAQRPLTDWAGGVAWSIAAYVCVMLLAIALCANHAYTVVPFYRMQAVKLVLTTALGHALPRRHAGGAEWGLGVFAGVLALWGYPVVRRPRCRFEICGGSGGLPPHCRRHHPQGGLSSARGGRSGLQTASADPARAFQPDHPRSEEHRRSQHAGHPFLWQIHAAGGSRARAMCNRHAPLSHRRSQQRIVRGLADESRTVLPAGAGLG